MIKNYFLFFGLLHLTLWTAVSPPTAIAFASQAESAPAAQPDSAPAPSPDSPNSPDSADPSVPSDRESRWQEALQNIQAALDEDPDEAAKFLGSAPIQSLELEELETLSERALQFMQLKEIERLQEQQAERRRLREYQDLQNSRR